MRLTVVNLTSGGLSGGYAKYLQSLLPLLAADARVDDLSVFYPAAVDVTNFPAGVPLQWRAGRRGPRDLAAQVARARPDVVFIPTARWMGFGGVPTAVMVRNMEPLEVPLAGNSPQEAVRNLARRFAAHRACRKASGIVAVSDHVKGFLQRRWGIAPERVERIYHGVDSADGGETQPRATEPGLAGRFIFTAGSIRPARGLEDAIVAMRPILDMRSEVKLLIAGGVDESGRRYHARMAALVSELGVAEHVAWLGPLDRSEMTWCFRRCAVFVMTSRAEACPNTLLEAMAHGSRIVSVSHPPMPEFLGAAATYYPPRAPQLLAARILNALADSSTDHELRAAAQRRALEFRWEVTADRTVAFLQRLAVGRPA